MASAHKVISYWSVTRQCKCRNLAYEQPNNQILLMEVIRDIIQNKLSFPLSKFSC